MNLIDAACEFHLAGLNPIPLKIDKSPAIPPGQNYLEEFVSIDWIEKYFPNAQKIGVVCGEVSSNLLCIDFDMHNEGEDVNTTFNEFIQTAFVKHLIDSNQLALYETPSGGKHIIFRTPEPEKTQRLAYYETGRVMIETRGEGGYIACYPSEGYKHLGGAELLHAPEIDDEAYLAMIDLAKSFTEKIIDEKPNTRDPNAPPVKWGEGWKENTPDGRYNIREGEAAFQLLLDNGWRINTIRQQKPGIVQLTRPGKPLEDGISATWGYRKNMFYVFSSSVTEFPVPDDQKGEAFSPFEILVRYEYGGDWRKAKDDLRELYGMKVKTNLKPVVLSEKETVKLTPFPIDVLPQDFQTYILAMNKALNFSPDILACAMMWTFGTTVGNKVKLRVKNGWTTPMIFWFSILGLKGTLKSHPLNEVIGALKDIDSTNKEFYDKQMEEYLSLEDKEKSKARKPLFSQNVVSDYTLEALHFLHSYNKRGLGLHKDELASFFKDMNKYRAGSDTEFWLESFSNSSFTVIRKTQEPLMIKNIMINIIGTIQPAVMIEMMRNHQDDGFLDRFLFTRAENTFHVINKNEVSDDVLNWWKNYVSDLNAECSFIDEKDTLISTMTDLAMDELIQVDKRFVEMQNDDSIDINTRTYISKIKTYLPRFALMLSLMDHKAPEVEQSHFNVEPIHIKKAEKIMQYFLNTAKHVFSESEELKDLKQVTDNIKGKTTAEKVIELKDRGFRNVDIAKALGIGASRVSQILKKD